MRALRGFCRVKQEVRRWRDIAEKRESKESERDLTSGQADYVQRQDLDSLWELFLQYGTFDNQVHLSGFLDFFCRSLEI